MRTFLVLLSLLGAQEGEWAVDWPDAARRARDEKKLVLVLVELYGGLTIPERLPSIFLNGDLADLKHHRFIGLRWKSGMKAPFQDPAIYGMGTMTFGAAVLVATPDGRIVGQCTPLGSTFLDVTLRSILRKHPEFAGTPPADVRDPLDRAELHLKRGDLEEAEALLREPATARGFRLQAALWARSRRGKEALAAIARARERAGPELQADLSLDEAGVLLGMGRSRDAAKALVSVLERHPSSPRLGEAKYLLSHILLRHTLADGKAGFEETVRTCPGTRWAKASEAILRSGTLETVAAGRLEWPDDRTVEFAGDVARKPLTTSDAARAAEDAVGYLIRSQRDDGTWTSPASLGSEAAAFTVATTAICATSLLPYRDRNEVSKGLDRALEYLVAAQASAALDRQGRHFGFGYAVWGRTFALRFLARRPGDRARVSGAMKSLVGELIRDQTPAGGWTYYAGVEPSFVTAPVLLALLEAKEAGIDVPEPVLAKGLGALEATRDARGAFRYSQGGANPRAEAGPRSPLCALALLRGGRGNVQGVLSGLDRYVEGRLDVRKERGKALCHTGPDGTAAYYLLFGYAFAAEALGRVPKEKRNAYREALLEDVLAARLADGSFLDFPAMGRDYGAGMALTALAGLIEP